MAAQQQSGNFLRSIFEFDEALHSFISNDNLAMAEQLGLFLTLHKVEHAETFYKHIVGLRLINQITASLQLNTDPNKALRTQTVLSIVEYIKTNPRCREDELQAQIMRQIEAFAQSVQ
ncbi:uncharacterized protein LOC111260621 [Varroa jacobsoni]|uniref:Uncharacterized protein n=1 Tax=Varroa destructor TaxID=109461 RepID=A0A7M7J7I0_VARDE|nr:uncharacterized protein LOC111244769 [Varroa destructor]XP_022689254.1 uncharacterized protein LOC111260621 [Varroa jacobsoni]XP_022689255.1 uncharacterized protein LOC111260621 [Varroa jacobsoni]